MPSANYTLTIRFSPLDDQAYRVQLVGPTSGFVAVLFTSGSLALWSEMQSCWLSTTPAFL